ncbi:MAG TPA: GNAT family N-acetyltransferase, partial [Polyangiales bacterium]
RAHGIGTALLQAAIRWATTERDLIWIDLSVFAHNDRARRLYRGLGFNEIGHTVDAYRVNDQVIDDVHMALRVG